MKVTITETYHDCDHFGCSGGYIKKISVSDGNINFEVQSSGSCFGDDEEDLIKDLLNTYRQKLLNDIK